MTRPLSAIEWEEIQRLFRDQNIYNVGISDANEVDDFIKQNFLEYLKNNYHGEMNYLERNLDKRFSPQQLQPGTQSIITFILPYYQELPKQWTEKISIYVTKNDYHNVAKKIGKPVIDFLQKIDPEFHPRVYVDSAPMIDKYWAWKAGLGFIGENTLLINEQYGSYVFISNIFTSFQPPVENITQPQSDKCSNCKKCIEACPTQALLHNKKLNASKCISYLTIEKKQNDYSDLSNKNTNYIYGCDICQNVCPYNSNIPQTIIDDFIFNEEEKSLLKNWAIGISDYPKNLLQKSVIKRKIY
jgi:epoxyqueuosine reductase